MGLQGRVRCAWGWALGGVMTRTASASSSRARCAPSSTSWSGRKINSIPAAFLVDGDTGVILATGESLRGPGLEGTWKAALEKKEKK